MERSIAVESVFHTWRKGKEARHLDCKGDKEDFWGHCRKAEQDQAVRCFTEQPLGSPV